MKTITDQILKDHAMKFAKSTRYKVVTRLISMNEIWEQWYNEFLKYEYLSADDPCPDCGKLRNEKGHCDCPKSYL